jgi:hypothetical protein
MSDYDKEQWQAEQAAQDSAQNAYRDKMAKARERSARNAKRKISRLHAKLTELGHISEFEDEFGESVLERLETFGSAFHDLEKGRAGDALSAAQKQVVARMNKKVKDLKAKKLAEKEGQALDPDAEFERTQPAWKSKAQKGFKPKSSFGRKNGYVPRVRHIEDDLPEEQDVSRPPKVDFSDPKIEPFLPEYIPPQKIGSEIAPKAKRPFLRIVSSEDP